MMAEVVIALDVPSGADLVVGRPVLQASDGGAAFRGFLEEAQCVGS
jgi:orotidine-5'-phosphate decarboxylase